MRVNADGRSELLIRLTWSKDGRARSGSGIYITASTWSADAERPKKGIDPECKQVTAQIAELESQILSALVEADPAELGSEWLKEQVDRYHRPQLYISNKTTKLLECISCFVANADDRQHENGRKVCRRTILQYKTTQRKITSFIQSLGKKDMLLSDIDNVFYQKFVGYLQREGLANNTIGREIKTLKIFINSLDADRKALVDISKLRVLKEEVDNIYLNEEELQMIHDAELPPHLDRVRDCFLLLAWTGCRYSDLQQIDKSNIKGEVLTFRQHKTNNRVSIPIHPVVREVLEKYNYELPAEISNQKFNDYIKEVARLAGMTMIETKTRTEGGKAKTTRCEKWQLVSSHTGRRSFATNMYKRGLPSIMIMSITGHKTESAFLKYIKVRSEEHAEMMLNEWRKMYE